MPTCLPALVNAVSSRWQVAGWVLLPPTALLAPLASVPPRLLCPLPALPSRLLSSSVGQAKGRTGEAIGRLCQLAPPTALLLEVDGSGAVAAEREVPTTLLHRGDLLKARCAGQLLLCGMLLRSVCLPLCWWRGQAAGGVHGGTALRRWQPCQQPRLRPCLPTSHRPAAPPRQVLPGARVPTDGVVVEGQSHVDESMLTGESVPVAKAPGDPLIGGTVNVGGPLRLRVVRVGADTALAQIVRLVEAAQVRR